MSLITGKITNPNGTAFDGILTFRSVSTPIRRDDDLVKEEKKTTVGTSAQGEFSITLLAGKYILEIPGQDKKLRLTVPTDDDAYDLLECLDSVVTFTGTPGEGHTLLATALAPGKVRLDSAAPNPDNPTVYTKQAVDALIAEIETGVMFLSGGGARLKVNSGATGIDLQLRNTIDALWYTIVVFNADGGQVGIAVETIGEF